jgi:AraC family transcriptional regulator
MIEQIRRVRSEPAASCLRHNVRRLGEIAMASQEATLPQSRAIRLARYAALSEMASHFHELPSLSLIVSGLYEERVRGRVSEHGAGSLLFYPAFEPHSQSFRASGTCQILITPTPADLDFLSEHVELGDAPYIRSDALRDLSARLLVEMRSADTFSQLVVHGLTLEALALFCRSSARPRTNILPWLREVKSFIDSNFVDTLTLDELARKVGRHPVHVSRAFQRAYGQTVGECIRAARVHSAARLLLSSTQPISEIASECGFCDQAHLSRAFKRVFNLTPTAYRLAGQ